MVERSAEDIIVDMETQLLTIRDFARAIGYACDGRRGEHLAVIARLAHACIDVAQEAEDMRTDAWEAIRVSRETAAVTG